MGRYIIKAARDEDLYMEFSTVVDAPTLIGTRQEFLDYFHRHQDQRAAPIEERLARADKTGTSAIHDPLSSYRGILDGAWEDDYLIIEQRGLLSRDRFVEFLRLYDTEDQEQAYALLKPFED